MTCQSHSHTFRNPFANQIANGGPPQIVRDVLGLNFVDDGLTFPFSLLVYNDLTQLISPEVNCAGKSGRWRFRLYRKK
jgi:hypothetical protein